MTDRYAMHERARFLGAQRHAHPGGVGGVVLVAKYQSGYGNSVEIDHGATLITRYAHASRLLVKPGDVVERGQEIARVGSSGRSTGEAAHENVHSLR